MRRALDAAILELGTLGDRDKILDRFFAHAQTLFDFSVLFVVRGDAAHGRNVHGLGAPAGLVARLQFSLNEPGILSKARELRKEFMVSGLGTEADGRLFGSIGRALPTALVFPLTVRDRVVAIFIGDGSGEGMDARARQSGRAPHEVASEEMLIWASAAGQALERLILRKKSGDSMPPPRTSAPPPPAYDIPIARPAPLPSNLGLTPAEVEPPPAEEPFVAPPRSRARGVMVVLGLGLVAAIVAIGYVWYERREPDVDKVVVAGSKLGGWPKEVDPIAALDVLRGATGLRTKGDLGAIEAEVGANGRVDLSAPAKNSEGKLLNVTFVDEDNESDVRVDSGGVHQGRLQLRRRCGEKLCRESVPMPKCTFKQIIDAAKTVGLSDDDRPLVRYGDTTRAPGPEWLVTLPDRGRIRLDANTCAPLPRERLRPAALPIAKVPGAPRAVDPLEVAPIARSQSGLEADARLLEIDARGVGENGRVDLSASEARITFVFADVGTATRRWRQIAVRGDGIPVPPDDGDRDPLPVRFFAAVTPAPRCTFAQVREYFVRDTAYTKAPAHITYGPDTALGQSGQWTVVVAGLGSRTISDPECESSLGAANAPKPKR